jgi:Protein of unknown function (DUF1232)
MARLWADAESAYRARILETLPEADPSARLLDVGCDDGGWTEEVRRRLSVPANHVHGLEIVKVRADAAPGTLPGRLASRLAKLDPRHAHFIGIAARPWRRRAAPVLSEPERRSYKLLTVAAALYVLLPFDVIPDFIPIVGHFDDALVVALVLQSVRHDWLAGLRRLLRGRRLSRCPG